MLNCGRGNAPACDRRKRNLQLPRCVQGYQYAGYAPEVFAPGECLWLNRSTNREMLWRFASGY